MQSEKVDNVGRLINLNPLAPRYVIIDALEQHPDNIAAAEAEVHLYVKKIQDDMARKRVQILDDDPDEAEVSLISC